MQLNDKVKNMVANAFPFAARTGAEVVELERGYVKMTMPFKGNQNHVNTMYAGALFTLAELPGGAICLSSFDMRKYYPIVKSMTVDFKKAVKTDATVIAKLDDEVITATAETAAERGKADYELTTEIYDESGTLCATTTGVYQLRSLGR